MKRKLLFTGLRILLTAVIVWFGYWSSRDMYRGYVSYPTTRNGQVNADIVQIASRVSGPIINVAVVDNQFVNEGDLLFEIDPSTFEVSLAQAEAQLDEIRDELTAEAATVKSEKANLEQVRAQVNEAEADVRKSEVQVAYDKVTFDRYAKLVDRGGVSQSDYDQTRATYEVALANLTEAKTALLVAQTGIVKGEAAVAEAEAQLGAPGDANAQLRTAKAAVDQAALNLSFTRVYAPVSGMVTNLSTQRGTHAVANSPLLALVDSETLRVDGYFKETLMQYIAPGDPAVVVLMGYPDQTLKGRVESIGWGIAQQDGSPGTFLLPNVNPTFDWIRLAQRIPVRVKIERLPPGVELRVGTTASVQIKNAVPLVRDIR